jgi:tetratricopeptide (TPR) repeat protein
MVRLRRLVIGCLFVSCLLAVSGAQGHATSNSSLELVLEERTAQLTLRIEVRDLDALLALDTNGDRLAESTEVAAQRDAIVDYVVSRVELQADGTRCSLSSDEPALAGSLVVTVLTARCASPIAQLRLRHDVLFEHDRAHRAIIRVHAGDQNWSDVLTAERRELTVQRAAQTPFAALGRFVAEGVKHIWLGFDHVLFLLTLLLPAVLVWSPHGFAPVSRARTALLEVVKVVTAFTLAHSVTLSLAALELIALPSRFVESSIAVSLIVAALANLLPSLRIRGATMAFGFGLLHGFGFASVLRELGLPSGSVGVALLGFNVGVELGQLCIVALCLPVLIALRSMRRYVPYVLRGGSLAVVLVAAVWFVERAFAVELVEPVVHAALRGSSRSLEDAERERSAGQRARSEHDYARAGQHLLRASELYARAGDLASQADLLGRLGDVALAQAEPVNAKAHYEASMRLREQLQDQRGIASACHQLALVARVRGDRTEAASWLRRAIELEQRLSLDRHVRRDSVQLASLYRETDQLESALAALTRAVQLDESLGMSTELASDLGKLAVINQLLGRLPEARRLYARVAALPLSESGEGERANALANDGSVARMQGHDEAASARYRQALSLFERAGAIESAARVRELLGELEPDRIP